MPRRFDEDRRNKYARSAQAWLALVAQVTHRRTTTYDALGALLQSHPLTLRSDLDPIDDYCMESPQSQHGIPKTENPQTGTVGRATNRPRPVHPAFNMEPETPQHGFNPATRNPRIVRHFQATTSLQQANYMESQGHYMESPS